MPYEISENKNRKGMNEREKEASVKTHLGFLGIGGLGGVANHDPSSAGGFTFFV
jgi:hypothetical protein